MNWQAVAEQAAGGRCREIMRRIEATIADHAPAARTESDDGVIRVAGRGLKQRWLSEPALRFARWVRP
jgi:hypothetical protein